MQGTIIGEMKARAIAAGITIAFMAFVRPDPEPEPELWGVALVALLMYEGIGWSLEYIRELRQKKKEERYATVSLGDIRRWADTKMEEVS